MKISKLEKFINKAKFIHGDVYDYSLVDYIKSNIHVKIICSIHGVFNQTPNNHLKGTGCKSCGYNRTKLKNTTPISEFLDAARAKHGNKYDYTNIRYTGLCSPIDIVCPIHGGFTQLPNTHLSTNGCTKCSNEIRAKSNTSTALEFIQTATRIHGNKYGYDMVNYINNKTNITISCKTHGYFDQLPSNHLRGAGCPSCSHCASSSELEIFEYVSSFGFDVLKTQTEISPYELDVYIPEKNLAIEFNGVYWHSSGSVVNDTYMASSHLKKTELCESKGIQLLHIFENEWNDPIKKEIWKSLIKSKLGLCDRIYARKCEIKLISHKAANDFCENNHLQGMCQHSRAKGLYYNNELVMVATFAKPRYTKNYDTELIRMCSKIGFNIIGGASKLLKEETNLVSYANRRWSTGNVYSKTGFERIGISQPCYYYVYRGALYHRSSFMKHKLKDKLKIFDDSLSERENMYNNGYRRIWDCGNLIYEKL